MATLKDINKLFDKFQIELLFYKLKNIIESDCDRGFAENGSILYCQFIKYAKIEKKENVRLFNNCTDYFSVLGRFDDKEINLVYKEYSEPVVPLLFTTLMLGVLSDESTENYSLTINGNIVCDFTKFGSHRVIESFHFGDWIQFFNAEINVREKEIEDKFVREIYNKYNSNLDEKNFTSDIEEKNLKSKIEDKISDINKFAINSTKKIKTIKSVNNKNNSNNNSILINKFIKGDRSKSSIISLLGIITKKNIEVNGQGVKYILSWNHGKRKVTLNKMESIIYIENKLRKKSHFK